MALVVWLTCALCQGETKLPRRISTAEVGTVKLEVEQPAHLNKVQIRVRDYAARNHQLKSVSCELFYVGEDGKQSKLETISLQQVSPTSDDYAGSSSDGHQLAHGSIVNAVYKSDGLRLPIATWQALYYH